MGRSRHDDGRRRLLLLLLPASRFHFTDDDSHGRRAFRHYYHRPRRQFIEVQAEEPRHAVDTAPMIRGRQTSRAVTAHISAAAVASRRFRFKRRFAHFRLFLEPCRRELSPAFIKSLPFRRSAASIVEHRVRASIGFSPVGRP